MANGWFEDQEQLFFYSRIRALENRWTKCISVARDYKETRQNVVYICYAYQCHCRATNFFEHPSQVLQRNMRIMPKNGAILILPTSGASHSLLLFPQSSPASDLCKCQDRVWRLVRRQLPHLPIPMTTLIHPPITQFISQHVGHRLANHSDKVSGWCY